MITIDVKKGKMVTIEIRGHAGAGELGEDVVCAAVTTLCLTYARAMTQIRAKGFSSVMQNGYAYLECKRMKANAPYVHMMLSGLVMLAEMYPEYITMTKENIEEVIGKGE